MKQYCTQIGEYFTLDMFTLAFLMVQKPPPPENCGYCEIAVHSAEISAQGPRARAIKAITIDHQSSSDSSKNTTGRTRNIWQ